MRTIQGLVSKLSFTAVGVVTGMILVAGTGAAAVQFTRTTASDHSIDAVQSPSTHDSSLGKEDSSVGGGDDIVPEPTEASEQAESPEPMDDNSASKPASTDNSASKPASTDNSGQTSSHDVEAARSPEPGDDHGRDGSH
jgi:cytoskeletal protein RodZ